MEQETHTHTQTVELIFQMLWFSSCQIVVFAMDLHITQAPLWHPDEKQNSLIFCIVRPSASVSTDLNRCSCATYSPK